MFFYNLLCNNNIIITLYNNFIKRKQQKVLISYCDNYNNRKKLCVKIVFVRETTEVYFICYTCSSYFIQLFYTLILYDV